MASITHAFAEARANGLTISMNVSKRYKSMARIGHLTRRRICRADGDEESGDISIQDANFELYMTRQLRFRAGEIDRFLLTSLICLSHVQQIPALRE